MQYLIKTHRIPDNPKVAYALMRKYKWWPVWVYDDYFWTVDEAVTYVKKCDQRHGTISSIVIEEFQR